MHLDLDSQLDRDGRPPGDGSRRTRRDAEGLPVGHARRWRCGARRLGARRAGKGGVEDDVESSTTPSPSSTFRPPSTPRRSAAPRCRHRLATETTRVLGAVERAPSPCPARGARTAAVAKPFFDFGGRHGGRGRLHQDRGRVRGPGHCCVQGPGVPDRLSALLAAAVSIHSVEARHAAWIRFLAGAPLASPHSTSRSRCPRCGSSWPRLASSRRSRVRSRRRSRDSPADASSCPRRCSGGARRRRRGRPRFVERGANGEAARRSARSRRRFRRTYPLAPPPRHGLAVPQPRLLSARDDAVALWAPVLRSVALRDAPSVSGRIVARVAASTPALRRTSCSSPARRVPEGGSGSRFVRTERPVGLRGRRSVDTSRSRRAYSSTHTRSPQRCGARTRSSSARASGSAPPPLRPRRSPLRPEHARRDMERLLRAGGVRHERAIHAHRLAGRRVRHPRDEPARPHSRADLARRHSHAERRHRRARAGDAGGNPGGDHMRRVATPLTALLVGLTLAAPARAQDAPTELWSQYPLVPKVEQAAPSPVGPFVPPRDEGCRWRTTPRARNTGCR